MTRRLYVHHEQSRVGVLEQGPDDVLEFTYDAGWIGERGFPISLAMPLREEPYREPAHTFFSNLLPEGDTRTFLCRRLGISPANDFELLAAIGGECAGALTLTTELEPPEATGANYRPLDLKELARLAAKRVLPSIDGQKGLRLSLAGAQDKLPVRLDGTRILLPVGSAPSTHILKFPNPSYKHLPANEVFVTMIAERLGLPVVTLDLWGLRREGMCVVTRYDRVRSEDASIARRHQEDLCQALGLRATRKYEKEGGPYFAACFERVRSASVEPLTDGLQLVRWMAFNVLAMNADAHAKNLSILYGDEGPRLAPFYDLVSTRAYDRLSPDLAQTVGGVSDPALIRRAHWEQLAKDIGVGGRFVVEAVRELAERFPDAVTEASAGFVERYGDTPALAMIVPKIRRQARRVLKQLK